MAENKQLGTLQLNTKGVLSAIQEVNTALQNLGKGVDLDLTKIVNSKVSGELANLKKQIDEVSKAATGSTNAEKKAVDNQLKILETQASVARKYGKQRQQQEKAYSDWWNTELAKREKMELAALEMKAANARKYGQEQQKIAQEQAAATEKVQQEEARIQEEMARKAQESRNKWISTVVSIAGAASLAVLKNQWQEAINYATQYYDTLNEIRVVTMKTESEATKIGQDMRTLAKEMKVTSTELSKAAVTFYRQGLSDAEVQDRLKWVTEYAKVANIAFDEAAQLMTSAINTMGDSIEQSGFANVVEHIADVWLYLGDNAATSGEEIGKAMQKASASATEFGLSFEWLGTYIATVSEQTRQAPESIGNAFNTMLARMHQIKQSGFNDEDETRINDVAKALATINVELLDSEGQWRDMDKIYSDVAEKWGELDAKTKGYLATTMAGTRQQNVFYALMNDLSKGIEGGSRALELYKGAMEAAGTASKKFSIYQESIAASQANMTASLEELYSKLEPNVIKAFYDVIALLVDGLNNLGGVIPIVISAIAALTTVILTARTAIAATHPLVALMAGALAALASLGVMGGIGAIIGDITGVDKYEEAVNKITESQTKLASLQSAKTSLTEMLAKVQSGAKLTTEDLTKYSGALETVSSISPTAEAAVRGLTGGYEDQASALESLIGKTEDAINAELNLQQRMAETTLMNFANSEEYTKASAYNRNAFNKTRQGQSLSDAIMNNEALYADITKRLMPGKTVTTSDWYNLLANQTAEIEAAIDNFFSDYESVLTKAVQSQAKTAINQVIAALRTDVTTEQREYLGEVILDMLMGDDGKLDYEDVAQERIREIWNQLIKGAATAQSDEGRYRDELLKKIGSIWNEDAQMIYNGFWFKTDKIGIYENISNDMYEMILELAQMGASFHELMTMAATSSSVDEFSQKMIELKTNIEETNKALKGEDGTGKSEGGDKNPFKEYIDNITKASSQFDKIKSLQESISKGETYSLSDILDIAETNPEIIVATNNIEALTEALKKLEEESRKSIKDNIIAMLMGDEEAFKISGFSTGNLQGINTFAQLIDYYKSDKYKGFFGDQGVERSEQRIAMVNQYLESTAEHLMNVTQAGEKLEDTLTGIDQVISDMEKADALKEALSAQEDMSNYDPSKSLKAMTTLRDTLSELQGKQYKLGDIPDAAKNPEEFAQWMADAKAQATALMAEIQATAQAYGILTEAEIESAKAAEEARKAREDYIQSMKDLSQSIADEVEANKASLNGYADQITSLQTALEKGDVQGVAKQWKGFNDTIKSGLQKNYPQLAKVLADISTQEGSASKHTKELTKELKNAQKVATAKYFKDTAKAMYDVENGSASLADALSTFHTEEAKVVEAQLEYIDVSQKFADKTEVTTSEVSALAEVLGWTPQALLDNWDMVEPLLDGVKGSMEDLRAQFQEALWLNIIGSSDVDFSDVLNGLVAVQDAADAAVQALLATGEFEIEEKELTQDMRYFILDNPFTGAGHWEWKTAGSTVQVIKPKNPTGKTGGGGGSTKKSGGGGGGGGGKTNTESEATKTLNRMQEAYDLQKHLIDIYAAQASYYSETGQLQGVILYYEKQRDAIDKLNESIEKNMGEMKPQIEQYKKELSSLSETDEKYKEIKSDLESLQNQYKTYSLELINNQTKVESLTKAIKDQQDAIRDMEIDIENELYQAIEDREELRERKLQGRITLEKEVLRILEAQKQQEEEMLDARIELENLLTESIQGQKEKQREDLEARATLEQKIYDILVKQREEEEAMAEARLSFENTLADMLAENEQKQKSMLDARVSMEKEIYNILKEQAEAETKAQKDALNQLNARANIEKTINSVLEKREQLEKSMLDARANFEKTLANVMKANDQKRKSVLDARVSVENDLYNILVKQAEKEKEAAEEERRHLDTVVNKQNMIVEILEKRAALENSMAQARVSFENTLAGILSANEKKQDDMLNARLSLENEINGIIKAQTVSYRNSIKEAEEQAKSRAAIEKTINNVFKKQEELHKSMLKSRISLEDKILEILKAQVEEERDQILENAQSQIDALKEERDLLSEQLELRKKMAEQQDKQAELAKLEAQYARISADPTRQKEAMEIRQKINDLRDEISWDKAEDEVEAKQKDIDNQITGIEDYMEQVRNYYQDILDNPVELIAQAQQILQQSDAQIIAWLQENDKEFARSSSTRKQQMVEDWQDTIDSMRGITRDYWKEVAAISSMSDEQIIAWLKANDPDYASATSAIKAEMEQGWRDSMKKEEEVPEYYYNQVSNVMQGPDEDIIAWLKANSEEYKNASEAGKLQMEKNWQEMLDSMRGNTKTYWDEIAKIIMMSDDEIIEWLKANDQDYLDASEEGRKLMVEDWKKALREMRGETEDFYEEAERIAEMTPEELVEWAKENDVDYANATEAMKQQMENSWKDIVEETKDNTADYWELVETILKGTDEEIIAWMKEHSDDYAGSTEAAQQQMEEKWRDSLKNMHGITETYWTDVTDLMKKSDDEIIEWLKANDESYLTASEADKERMVNSWKESLMAIRGETKTRWAEVSEIAKKTNDEIIEWLKANDIEYLNSSETIQKQMVENWKSTFNAITTDAVDYWLEVGNVMKMTNEEIVDWLKEHSPEYADATDAGKEQMVNKWQDSLDSMRGITKTYWNEIASIMEMSDAEIIGYMMANNEAYQNASVEGKAKLVSEWKTAIADMRGESSVFYKETEEDAKKTNEEIIAWLKANDEDYLKASVVVQEQMVENWQTVLNNTGTALTVTWDEVNEKMSLSAEDLKKFLIENDQEIAEAYGSNKEILIQDLLDMVNQAQGIQDGVAETVAEKMTLSYEEIIEYLKETNVEYQKASDDQKAKMEKEWRDLLKKANGEVEDNSEEVAKILEKSYDELIEWFKENDLEYARASEAVKTNMLNGWRDMYNDMEGITITYWDEVHRIMAQGDDAIVEFLKLNSKKYKEASSLQAQAYLDGWLEKLDLLRKALETVVEDAIGVNDLVNTITSPEPSPTSSSSSSSGGGGGGGDSTPKTLLRYDYSDQGDSGHKKYPVYNTGPGEGTLEPHDKDKKVETGGTYTCYCSKCGHYMGIEDNPNKQTSIATTSPKSSSNTKPGLPSLPASTSSNVTDSAKKAAVPVSVLLTDVSGVQDTPKKVTTKTPKVKAISFDTGGMPSNEGLAFVHDKERILNPYQTELFESMVRAMEAMNRIMVPDVPSFGSDTLFGGNANSVSVGDIIVQVEKMETDADYEDMADRVLNAILERLNRGTAIGGIRFSR